MEAFSILSLYHILILLLIKVLFSLSQPLCHDDEMSSLLKFKQSFNVDKSASVDPLAYPKMNYWTSKTDCCVWDGVECDRDSGYVIIVDLSSSFLYGSIHSNTTLFNLVHLHTLNLADNNFNYSQIPSSLKQLSKLTYLNLSNSVFTGRIPSEISGLSHLSVLDLSGNIDLSPETDLKILLENMINLEVLSLSTVNISSSFPTFLTNFSSLTSLNMRRCGIVGNFPAAIFQLPNLQYLKLGSNDLTGEFPPFNHNSSLKVLEISNNQFSGKLPESIGVLSNLIEFHAQLCNFHGVIPHSLGNLTQLIHLDLKLNRFNGSFPLLFSKLMNLRSLDLAGNELSGVIDFDMFLALKNLTVLRLSKNNLTLFIKPERNETLPQYTSLGLSFCTLSDFPNFLRHQMKLESLNLKHTNIGGVIPKWLMNISSETLFNLNLAENSFTGELSPAICNHEHLSVLNLYQNRFYGKLPTCLGNFSSSLAWLNLHGNSFSGKIPEFGESSELQIINLRDNMLQGKVPQSLKNCKQLAYLVLANNQLEDVFPHWLGKNSELKILVLRSNRFHGVIEDRHSNVDFPQLRIIDISNNCFTGSLPAKYIRNWKAMKLENIRELSYMKTTNFSISTTVKVKYFFDVTLKIKGVRRYYGKINEEIAVLDFSNNCFEGEIPDVIGDLKGLFAIDFSGNKLSGEIPSSLGKLSKLESLDLSQNKLSGEIPQELTKLNFLQYFNVSYNQLTGPIQLSRFDASSFIGNLGLCGIPLPDKCVKSEAPNSSINGSEEGSDDSLDFSWKVITIGYACGFFVGLFIRQVTMARILSWFAMVFRVRNVQARK